MADVDPIRPRPSDPRRISYLFIFAALVLAGWLHLATPLLAALFAYLALTKLHLAGRIGKWAAVAFFLVLVAAIVYGMGFFVRRAVRDLPEIADQAIPSIIDWAKQYRIELPFTDFDSLKTLASDTIRGQANYLGNVARFARGATEQILFLVVGCVVAIGLFLNPRFDLEGHLNRPRNNFYSACGEAIAGRFGTFYRSFETVMGAQIVISAINTVLTAIFVLSLRLPYAPVIIGLTFLWGLVPVVGNLISNTITVGIGFTVSPKTALFALVFLVLIHKLEYFLNSKIVGNRIRNPFWLTLLGLVLGEKLMGVPGMVLAPVVLNYLKLEMSKIEVPASTAEPGRGPPNIEPRAPERQPAPNLQA